MHGRGSLHIIILISFLLLNIQLSYSKTCRGTNHKFTRHGNSASRLKELKKNFAGCTKIDGNLEIVDAKEKDEDWTFLESITEISGYLLVYDSYLPSIPLPNLVLIHGETLLKDKAFNDKEYSMLIANNKVGDNPIGLVSLLEITRGDVMIHENSLCNVDDVLWTDITYGNNIIEKNAENCSPCSTECESFEGKKHCWGSNVTQCQTLTKKVCAEACGGRCFGPEPNQCCSLTCVGGCSGHSNKDCFACKTLSDEGVCVENCPPPMIYDPINYKTIPNPNAKFAYGHECVKECPNHMYRSGPACVNRCPEGTTADDETSTCEECKGPCPKSCIFTEEYLTSSNIDSLQDCTIIDGAIQINDGSFNTEFDRIPLSKEKLKILENVTLIENNLVISTDQIDDLSFLKNLKRVNGKNLWYGATLYIGHTNITRLDLDSLEFVGNGKLAISNNNQLCHASGINWEKALQLNKSQISVKKNMNETICEQEGRVCHSECSSDGCRGPLDRDCISCKTMKQGDQCVNQCGKRYYEKAKKCIPCHPQCANSCSNQEPNTCDSCLNFKDGPNCVEACPVEKFPDANGQCQPCNPLCKDGCYDATDLYGSSKGCKDCFIFRMDKSGYEKVQCLPENENCPNKYYLTRSMYCKECHHECDRCFGPSNINCDLSTCKNVILHDKCERRCIRNTYPDNRGSPYPKPICKDCDSICIECTGPTSMDCVTCSGLKVYVDYENREINPKYNCTSECPKEFPNIIQEELNNKKSSVCVSDNYAYAATGSSKGRIGLILGLIFAFLILLAVIFLVIFYLRKQAAKKVFEARRLEAKIGGFEDNEPLMPTDAQPDVAHLLVVQEAELRKENVIGSGAFGTVYKGVFVPKGKNLKMPVAIKVLSEGSTSSQNAELLDEARIMASVNHPYCVRLTAICMTSPIQLITPLMPFGSLLDYLRKNKNNIGSKNLLNWALQISKGMEYLEKRGIVHRDLAARNVLVKNANVVKITDFGLSKLLEVNQEKIEAKDGKLPIKWMAVESIRHKIFTHKSDVWSYGVTIWELFTFGSRPYEFLPAHEVLMMLEKGQRLSQPEICTIDIYMLMIKCWMVDAESRPSFKDLSQEFSRMSRDPGRFIVIQGDEFMKLPTHNIEVEDLVDTDGPEKVISMDDYYLQPSPENTDNQGDNYLNPKIDYGDDGVKFTKGKEKKPVQSLPSSRYTTDPTKKPKEAYNDPNLDVAIESEYMPSDNYLSKQDGIKGSLSSLTDHLKDLKSKAYNKINKYENLINRDSVDNYNNNYLNQINDNDKNMSNKSEPSYLSMNKEPLQNKAKLAEFEDDAIDDDEDDYLTEVKMANDVTKPRSNYYNTRNNQKF